MMAEKRELCFYFFLELTPVCLLLSPESCVLTHSSHVLLSFALWLIVGFFACRGYDCSCLKNSSLSGESVLWCYCHFSGRRLGFAFTRCFNIKCFGLIEW